MTQLIARHLKKSYKGREVVSDLSMAVSPGEIVGLLGPNGAGKTTSFYMIVGLVPATAGDVSINGRVVTRLPMFRRARMGIGYLPQEPSVFRRLSVHDNLDCIAQSLPISKVARKERV